MYMHVLLCMPTYVHGFMSLFPLTLSHISFSCSSCTFLPLSLLPPPPPPSLQDQVNQMEADCTVIEESLLERQIGHETSSDESLEFPTTLAEKHRLQEERERLLTLSDMLDPILKLFCQQLQLLDKVQVRSKVIAMVTECVGRKDELESLLIDAKVNVRACACNILG